MAKQPVPRKRSRGVHVLEFLLVLVILAVLYYMVFVVAVPCGSTANGHWTIWQMLSGGRCNAP